MNTVNLNTFVTVMHTGSISATADLLHLSQPAISKRIKNLEEEFGVKLFDMVGRGIMPTPSAYELLPHAKRWISDYEHCRSLIQNHQSQVAGKLVIGTSHHIGLHYIAKILKDFIQNYPKIQLDVHFLDSEKAHKSVLEGNVSLAFLTLPPIFNHRLEYHTLWHDPLFFVADLKSPLANKSNISLRTLTTYPALLPAANTFMSQITLATFAKHNLRPTATMHNNPLEAIRVLVSIGLGWSVLPNTLIDDTLIKLNINKDISLSRQLGMVINPNLTHSSATKALIKFLQNPNI